MSEQDTFAKMGRNYQERVVTALMSDYAYADQMADVMKPEHFDVKYLQEIVGAFFEHKKKFKTFPSPEMLDVMITREKEVDPTLTTQVREYLARAKSIPMNGDTAYIQESSLEFCRKQNLKDGLVQAIDLMETGNYDSIQGVIRDALNKGATRDLGHKYNEGLARRTQQAKRDPIPTGWAPLDKAFNGGWERGILATFIAPTGAGKSMFLVNCGAAALEKGLNVLYITLEMADWKIGLRFDSYYSGVRINDVAAQTDKVQGEINQKVRGQLWVKEWPTKRASVQTISAYIQRLRTIEGFIPDMVIVDYADLLKSSGRKGDKRFELEETYEELRALAQELKVVMVTADQTNRSGLEMEIVTIAQIGEAYAKATVCDVIMTVSRRMEDKQAKTGRLFLAKSRLGDDGMVYPFLLDTATVKVEMLEQGTDPIERLMQDAESKKNIMRNRFDQYERWKNGKGGGSDSDI